ncbi:UNVERIFIED_CONTAM: hypothetical protein K2H54_000210 [Gekko kuhli]
MTETTAQGTVKRTNKFAEDKEVPVQFRATLADYHRSGYDRGHQAPAADMRSTTTTMKESFLLTNMTPQLPELNRGSWRILEEKARQWAITYKGRFGAGHILWKAKDEFIDQLAKCRVERHGPQAEKSFEVMRKWLTVEAGYYTTVMLPDGGVRKEAKSIKFGKMDQAEFADLYRAVFGVCWRYVLNRKFSSEAEAENAVAQLMGFAG